MSLKTSSRSSPLRLAILDDYANLAAPIFSHIPTLDIESFPETLDPKNPSDLSRIIERLQPFDIISTMRERTPFPENLLASLPNLKLLVTTGPRNLSFDIPAATSRGVTVLGTVGLGRSENPLNEDDAKLLYKHDSTTQHTWALILALANSLKRDDHALGNGSKDWQSGFIVGLAGKKLGILGLGRLGSRVARIGIQSFGMKVITWSANLTQERADNEAEKCGLPAGSFRIVSKEELFSKADVLSVHYVLSPRSVKIAGVEDLSRMKQTAIFVNTSRGALVDEDALIKVLKQGKIKGAGLDVFSAEPLPASSLWRSEPWGQGGRSEVIMTPHMGYVEQDTMHRWYEEQAENVERWISGKELLNKLN